MLPTRVGRSSRVLKVLPTRVGRSLRVLKVLPTRVGRSSRVLKGSATRVDRFSSEENGKNRSKAEANISYKQSKRPFDCAQGDEIIA